MNDFPVFLFDIDSVLVTPVGYRAAVRATLKFFYDRMGLPGSLLPDEYVLDGFEAIRITSEWDMVPICLAAAFDRWRAANPGAELPGRLPEAIDRIHDTSLAANLPDSIDYLGLQKRLKGRLPVGEYPARTVLKLTKADQGGLLFGSIESPGLLEELLAHTRDLDRSWTTRIFQHFTLGSAAFERSYERPAEIQTPSLLASLDQPQISAALSRLVVELQQSGRLYPAAYTMRPSLAPRGVEDHLPLKYVPEAEIALELVGLSEIPLIGYGRMVYLADQLGLEPETLLKPSPVQAIAAVLAAIQGDEIAALQSAYNVYAKFNTRSDEPFPPITGPDPRLRVAIFEDSAGGIEAVHKAAEILRQAGLPVSVSSYGIATHPDKIEALRSAGASLYTSTDQAVRAALHSLNLASAG